MKSPAAGTTRERFQELAELRVAEARSLHSVGRFDGAYYLGGYAVECALKAVVTKNIVASVLPPKGSIDRVYTHKLEDLLDLAGLRPALKAAPGLLLSWSIVNQWSEEKRYTCGVDSATATDFLNALDAPENGVLTWLKRSW